jgi:hypothetical protein
VAIQRKLVEVPRRCIGKGTTQVESKVILSTYLVLASKRLQQQCVAFLNVALCPLRLGDGQGARIEGRVMVKPSSHPSKCLGTSRTHEEEYPHERIPPRKKDRGGNEMSPVQYFPLERVLAVQVFTVVSKADPVILLCSQQGFW